SPTAAALPTRRAYPATTRAAFALAPIAAFAYFDGISCPNTAANRPDTATNPSKSTPVAIPIPCSIYTTSSLARLPLHPRAHPPHPPPPPHPPSSPPAPPTPAHSPAPSPAYHESAPRSPRSAPPPTPAPTRRAPAAASPPRSYRRARSDTRPAPAAP